LALYDIFSYGSERGDEKHIAVTTRALAFLFVSLMFLMNQYKGRLKEDTSYRIQNRGGAMMRMTTMIVLAAATMIKHG
jgi:preprotein translocase subunit SecG